MIYTVTLNPCLDYVMDVDGFQAGEINRSSAEQVYPGGKGINVSQVLDALGVENAAVYFSAGGTGAFLTRLLEERGIATREVRLAEGRTRINVKIRSDRETAINAKGPAVTEADLAKLYEKVSEAGEGDVVVLSGNVPSTLSAEIYAEIGRLARWSGAEFVVDATGASLMTSLKEKPLFVKPNHEELGEILGREIETPEEAIEGARMLQREGARIVLVSMGSRGAALLWHDGSAYRADNPNIEVRNTVGAGDSMVAGFLTALLRDAGPEEALALGVAAGSATAMSDGLADRETMERLKKQVMVYALGGTQ